MNYSNRWQYKYSTPNHQKISMEEIIDFLRKMFSLCQGRMANKRGQIYERNVRHAYLFLRRHFGSRSTVIPSPRGPDLSFSRQRRCYKSRGSFPVYLASEVQKRSNAPVPGQKLATKVSKFRAIPQYVPGVNPPGMAADKCIRCIIPLTWDMLHDYRL